MIIPADAFDSKDQRGKPLPKESRDEVVRYLRERNLVAIVFSNEMKEFLEGRARRSNISVEQWVIDAVNLHARRPE